jgi:hypothetical protein
LGEEMINAEYYIYFFSSSYLDVYVFAALALLLGSTFFKDKFKKESNNLLYVFNTGAAWCSFFILIYSIIDLVIAWYGQNPYEWYAFSPKIDPYPVPLIYIKMYLPTLIGLFLFFRKLRINRIFTSVLLLVLNIGLIERLIYAYRGYLPSSWSTYYYEPYSEKIIKYSAAILFVIIIYVIAKKKNKLPYPSVFLK